MIIKLIAYGIAKDILKEGSLDFVVNEGASVSELKSSLIETYAEFEKLRSLRFAIDEDFQEDAYILKDTDVVVIIPPVSGG